MQVFAFKQSLKEVKTIMKRKNDFAVVRIAYWISTGIIALVELSGAFYINSEMAIEGTRHLGLPEWFRWEVSIGHLIGGILLIVPIHSRVKEWVYVAFGIDFISAFIGYLAVDGWGSSAFSPLIFFAILIVSYITYHKLLVEKKIAIKHISNCITIES